MQLYMDLGLPDEYADIQHETLLSVMRTATLISWATAQLFRPFGLTEAQFNVLILLKYRERALTQSDLGDRLGVTRASITSVLDRLEVKGLVSREVVAGNRRIYHVTLKAAGLAVLEKVESVYREMIGRLMGELTEKECRMMTECLGRVRNRAGEIGNDKRAGE